MTSVVQNKVTVVLSQSPNPDAARHELEAELAAELMREPSVDVSIIPHLYDLPADHAGWIFLQSVAGDLVVLAWMYPRATRWILDRHGVKGLPGQTPPETEPDRSRSADPSRARGGSVADAVKRRVYCIDLREHDMPTSYTEQIRGIAREATIGTVELAPGLLRDSAGTERFVRDPNADRPTCDGLPWARMWSATESGNGRERIEEAVSSDGRLVRKRWYPVIDYDRCTNCLECIDFCLFGVFGLDADERILVERGDNCKQGCPACSRVCPESAIIFPAHRTPAIAGADGEIGSLKVDLSKLFGATSALALAAQERDAASIKDGRVAVVARMASANDSPHESSRVPDELDELIDRLDNLDL